VANSKKRAKLAPDLLGPRSLRSATGPRKISLTDHESSHGLAAGPALPIGTYEPAEENGQHVLFQKGAATALAFKPLHWSYGSTEESEGSRPGRNSVSTNESASQPPPSSTPPPGETAKASVPAPATNHDSTIDTQVAQQALTTDLAQMIDSILRTREFATRGIHKSFRKRQVSPVLPVDQFSTSQELASALKGELACAKGDREDDVPLKRPLIDLVLGFIRVGEKAHHVATSETVRDQPKIR